MLKCAILKEIFYQDSISGIEKIAYEKNKGRNRQMEDADVSQKVLKQLYKTEFNKLTPEDIESVKRVIYKYMNQSGASGYQIIWTNIICMCMMMALLIAKKHREDMMMHQPEQSFILHFINTVNIFLYLNIKAKLYIKN